MSIDRRTQDHRYLLCRAPSQHRFLQTDIEILSTHTGNYSRDHARLSNEPIRNTRGTGCSTECAASGTWHAMNQSPQVLTNCAS